MTVARRPAPGKPASAEEPATAREVVLVVDDDDQMLRLVKRVLERAGFDCVPVGDGAAAHAAAVDWRPDIILLDLMLGSVASRLVHHSPIAVLVAKS